VISSEGKVIRSSAMILNGIPPMLNSAKPIVYRMEAPNLTLTRTEELILSRFYIIRIGAVRT
jgi:hypothetical protein